MKAVGPLVVVALLVSGCGADPRVVDTDDGVHVLVSGSSNGGSDALIVGTVSRVGDCLGIVGELDAQHVVVWPTGTEVVDGTRLTIEVPHLGRVELGQQVYLHGGYGSAADYDESPAIPEGCPEAEVAFANSDQSL